MKDEILIFKGAGGDTIVDCTSIGLGRDVEALRKLSRYTGVNIIASSGYYYKDTHPATMPAAKRTPHYQDVQLPTH